MATYNYMPHGVCSRMISFNLDEGKVSNVEFMGGCNGNLKGIGALVEGQNAEDIIARLDGIRCGMKETSCPDQLSQCLRAALAEEAAK